MAKQQTRSEYSAGGCVYKLQGTSNKKQALWLVGKHSGYHKWVLPKGLIEPGETAASTALREVEEEMGVKAKIIGGKPVHKEKYVYWADFFNEARGTKHEARKKIPEKRVVKYQEAGGERTKVNKTVTFYLMEWAEGDPKNHDWEMEEAGWFDFDDAYHKLAFAGEKEALKKAHDTISSE